MARTVQHTILIKNGQLYEQGVEEKSINTSLSAKRVDVQERCKVYITKPANNLIFVVSIRNSQRDDDDVVFCLWTA